MKFRPLLPVIALAGLLSACGGGVTVGDFDDEDDGVFPQVPFSSGRPAAVTVGNATEPTLNGSYASQDARISNVFRYHVDDTCRFQFDGLQQLNGQRVMGGEIHYSPGTNIVIRSFVVINRQEFRLDGGNTATVDRVNNAVSYNGALLTNWQDGRTITLSGSIPMRDETRSSGC